MESFVSKFIADSASDAALIPSFSFPKIPGVYRLPFLDAYEDVEVVFVTPSNAHDQVIIVKLAPGLYLDFIFNKHHKAFELLTVPEDGMDSETFAASWSRHNIAVPCPAEFADYRVVPGAYDDIDEDIMVSLDPFDVL